MEIINNHWRSKVTKVYIKLRYPYLISRMREFESAKNIEAIATSTPAHTVLKPIYDKVMEMRRYNVHVVFWRVRP
ncbi:hypothetical protein NW762_005591 [Fusarium torreyae]|uniref:Uncharacterized protein n=1 Tax=Fusarium torreyae TaxID=1237075 RepID=A0A9W8VF17_9HYPO|nr:hypothetical protein NW762_005591 [Fusarium torreyae]